MTSGAKVVQRRNRELLGDLASRFAPSLLRGVAWSLALLVVMSCTPFAGNTPAAPVELLLYDWEDDVPQHVLDQFTEETGLPVKFVAYESSEEASAALLAGEGYDVAVIENRYIPALIEEKALAKLDRSQLPNFKNISPAFRGLIYDPENAYSVPYSWGTSGIVVRSDLQTSIRRWADLWELDDSERVVFYRGQARETIGLTLKSLGFSANSEEPAELQAALERLLELRPVVEFSEDYDPVTVARALADGVGVAAMGYAFDITEGTALDVELDYVLPEEGGLLWGDNFVVPAASAHSAEAQQLIDFLLRPEVGAAIVNEKVFATANEAALPFVTPELASNAAVFPPEQEMEHLEIVLPLSTAGEKLYAQVWEQFLTANDTPLNQP